MRKHLTAIAILTLTAPAFAQGRKDGGLHIVWQWLSSLF